MGKVGRTLLDLARAGALAAGSAFLLGVWGQGMHRLGLRGTYPDGLPDFLIPFLIGVALGSWLGFPAPAARPVALLGRIAGTTLFAIAVGAALGGVAVLLVKWGVREGSLPFYFAPVGAALVAVGLRRLPRARAARIALGVPVALLLLARVLVFWPDGAHAITRRVFPLTTPMVRATVEREGWGQMAVNGRTRIVDLESTPRYYTANAWLRSDAGVRFTLEVAKPFFEDGCGDLHDNQPQPPEWVRAYPSLDACLKEHPTQREVEFEMLHIRHSPCCLYQAKPHQPGERIATDRTWTFVFTRLAWQPE